jgi:hypothetical protein
VANLIVGSKFADLLIEKGLIPGPANRIGRIIIDLKPWDVMTIWVQRVGDERWLDLDIPDGKAEIVWCDEGKPYDGPTMGDDETPA